jgi:poly(3-hydroxyalkanoate) synthetase
MPWAVSALIDGGVRRDGLVFAPPDAENRYVLRRYLARMMPGDWKLQEKWFNHNLEHPNAWSVRWEEPVSRDEKKPAVKDPPSKYEDWPAMMSTRQESVARLNKLLAS